MNTPAGVAANYLNTGVYKVRLHFWKMLLLAIMAGAFIALAGVGASTASCLVEGPSAAKLVSACVFPGGLAMVVLAGAVKAHLFDGIARDAETIALCMTRRWHRDEGEKRNAAG